VTQRRVHVSLTPPGGTVRHAPGTTAVVIDVLRATTSLAYACAHGVARVVAFAEPAEALAFRTRHADALVCGERGGRIVAGFDLGNSPAEYTSERMRGRTLAFASTNGSLALRATAGCRTRMLAAFVNASAVVRALAGARDVWIVGSGKLGEFALEDAALAGWLCERLAEQGVVTDGAEAALARALAPRAAGEVRALLQGAEQGRHLRSLGAGFAADVERCAALDSLAIAPQLDATGSVSDAAPATS